MNFFEKTTSSKTVYDGKILKLTVDDIILPDGNSAIRECVRHSGGAAVLLVQDKKVLLVKQYRYVYGKEIYEIPAGKMEKGEDPEKAAERELEEETGYRAEKLVHALDIYPTPGYTDEIIHIYFADNAHFTAKNPDEDEFINCEFIPLNGVLKMIESGEICDAKTIAAVYKYSYEQK